MDQPTARNVSHCSMLASPAIHDCCRGSAGPSSSCADANADDDHLSNFLKALDFIHDFTLICDSTYSAITLLTDLSCDATYRTHRYCCLCVANCSVTHVVLLLYDQKLAPRTLEINSERSVESHCAADGVVFAYKTAGCIRKSAGSKFSKDLLHGLDVAFNSAFGKNACKAG